MEPFSAEFNRQLVAAYRSVMKVEELMLRDLSGGDLTITEMHMLESVGCDGGGMHITDIAQEQGITLPTVTISVQRLERKGYVTKQRNAFDARRVSVKLTEKGRKAEIAHRYFHRQMIHGLLSGMTQQEREAGLSALTKLNAFLADKIESVSKVKDAGGGGK